MHRWIAITLGVGIVAIFMLCVALATIGAQLDKQTIEGNYLRSELGNFKTDIDKLAQERTRLRTEVQAHNEIIERLQDDLERSLNTIELLKSELVRTRSQVTKDLITASP